MLSWPSLVVGMESGVDEGQATEQHALLCVWGEGCCCSISEWQRRRWSDRSDRTLTAATPVPPAPCRQRRGLASPLTPSPRRPAWSGSWATQHFSEQAGAAGLLASWVFDSTGQLSVCCSELGCWWRWMQARDGSSCSLWPASACQPAAPPAPQALTPQPNAPPTWRRRNEQSCNKGGGDLAPSSGSPGKSPKKTSSQVGGWGRL